ncbi:hypothetical protein Trydic_g20586 [Trypoxylus dichotomus]
MPVPWSSTDLLDHLSSPADEFLAKRCVIFLCSFFWCVHWDLIVNIFVRIRSHVVKVRIVLLIAETFTD